MIKRRPTRQVQVGNVCIGNQAPISIQSMTNTPTDNTEKTLRQINQLALTGCDIVRVTYPTEDVADSFKAICTQSPIPIIADIHFNANLAIDALKNGADAIRINPGNMRNMDDIARVAQFAGKLNKCVRIGVNSGSLSPSVREKYSSPPPAEALVESALEYCRFFEQNHCDNIKVSLKSSNVITTIEAYKQFAELTDYPLHIGVTEAGTKENGIIKSSVALGALLADGIGDTLRISLTADPVEEIKAALKILQALAIRHTFPEIISCPTCGRTCIDLIPLAEQVDEEIQKIYAEGYAISLKKIAIMGCVVNGPGEARDADFGLAGGKGEGVLFRHGEIIGKIREEEFLSAIREELYKHRCSK